MAKKKQMEIPGAERKRVKELDDAAEAYVDQRDKRMAQSEKEKDAKDALIAAMRKNDVLVYRDDDHVPPLVVTLVSKDNVKVSEVDDDSEAEAA